MEQVKNYYKRFVKEGFDENGILNKFEIDCPDNYNFGYDIIDKFGEIDPDRRALIHIDLQENRHDFSYSQLSKLSTQAANLFKSERSGKSNNEKRLEPNCNISNINRGKYN